MKSFLQRAYPWYVVCVLMLVSVLSFVDRQIPNLMVGPIRADLQISDTQMSLLMGLSFALFYVICGIPLGRLADSRSRRGLIAAGLVFWSIATAFCGLARTYAQLFLARIGVGVGEAALAPAAYSLIADYFPPERRATAFAVYSMGIYLGSGLAFMLGGLVVVFALRNGPVELWLVGEIRAWQYVFILLGISGLLFSLILLTVREPARSATHAVAPVAEILKFYRQHRRTLLCHHLGFAFLAMSAYGSAAWLPSYFVRVHGWDAGRFGLAYGAIVMLFCSAGALFAGAWADRWRSRGRTDASLRVAMLSTLLSLLAGLWYVFPDSGNLAMIAIIPAAFLAGMPAGLAPAALQQLAPSNMLGQVTAVSLLVINFIGLGLGPTAVALCTDYLFANDQAVGWSMLVVCGAAQLLAVLLLASGLRAFRKSVKRFM